jgi:MftR C-terminal domain
LDYGAWRPVPASRVGPSCAAPPGKSRRVHGLLLVLAVTGSGSLPTTRNGRFWERRALRAHIINTEPELRGRASYYPFERVLAQAIGKDLGQPANSLIPRLAALSAVAGLRELYGSDEAQALAAPPNAAELLKLVDTVISFTQAGTDGAQ